MFICACGQAARSEFEFDRHPISRYCREEPVKAELEAKPAEYEDRAPDVLRYPKISKDEVFK